MGGCRCSYKNCLRATNNSEKDFHFFHYPVRDPERCLKWLTNAKKLSLQKLPEEQLRNKVVCQLHFEEQFFTNAFRKRLVHNAVPTVDAGSDDSPKNEEINVQVLQSDSEGNVFTVDTENLMQTETRDVTSYVIQNGNVIPADSPNNDIKPLMYKISVDDRITDVENNIYDNNTEEFVPSTKINYSHSINNSKNCFITDRDQWSENNESITPIYELQTPQIEEEKMIQDFIPLEDNFLEPIQSDPLVIENPNSMEVVHLSKTLQQHSKEIACLKRILKTKMKKSRNRRRFTNTQIINNLRGILPPTLHAAVSLHLLKKDDNFTKDEKHFLTVLYKASPAAYEILLKECKWKLPNPDVVKKLIAKRNCVR